ILVRLSGEAPQAAPSSGVGYWRRCPTRPTRRLRRSHDRRLDTRPRGRPRRPLLGGARSGTEWLARSATRRSDYVLARAERAPASTRSRGAWPPSQAGPPGPHVGAALRRALACGTPEQEELASSHTSAGPAMAPRPRGQATRSDRSHVAFTICFRWRKGANHAPDDLGRAG